jgi:aconitate hydratase 2/2-methylisocitrate dehydratase
MVGGYNVAALIELLNNSDEQLAKCAAQGLSRTLLVYDAFNEVMDLGHQQSLRQAGGRQLGRC